MAEVAATVAGEMDIVSGGGGVGVRVGGAEQGEYSVRGKESWSWLESTFFCWTTFIVGPLLLFASHSRQGTLLQVPEVVLKT